jgi:hypothetical protein
MDDEGELTKLFALGEQKAEAAILVERNALS